MLSQEMGCSQKQDCENAAIKRWLNKNPQKKYDFPVTPLGDDLYSRQLICKLALEKDYNFIFVCLSTSHKTLYEWLDFLFHSALELANSVYQKIRPTLVSRRSFFNDIRALLKYFWFETWSDLFNFMLDDNLSKPATNSS